MTQPSILSKAETFETVYEWADEFSEKQANIFWTADEIAVEKDKHCILTDMTEAERHAVIEVLKLFTLYELKAGADYWLGKYMRTFKRPELQRMAATFGFFELGVHKPFYAKLNEVLSLADDDFFLSYHDDEMLAEHMNFIVDMIRHNNPLISLAAFSMVEGAVLYSSFAFLKHFQSAGKNKLLNVVRGINFSVRDELCLSEDTEVLTERGWVPIKDVNVGESVVCYDTQSKCVVVEKCSNTTTSVSDVSYEFTGDGISQRVTPNHRMIVADGEVLAKDATNDHDYIVGAHTLSADVVALGLKDDLIKPNNTSKANVEKKEHESEVFYCLTVPTGAFFVRRNGKISVTGNCHSEAGAKTFLTLKDEMNLSEVDEAAIGAAVQQIAKSLHSHEKEIVSRLFSKGNIEGITETQLINFVESRINLCLRNLGYKNMFDVSYNPIADWFYDGISGFMFNDTFSGIGNSYVRNWDEEAFVYEEYNKNG